MAGRGVPGEQELGLKPGLLVPIGVRMEEESPSQSPQGRGRNWRGREGKEERKQEDARAEARPDVSYCLGQRA